MYEIFNNCDELLAYLFRAYDWHNASTDAVEFEGELCTIGYLAPNDHEMFFGAFSTSSKFPNTLFLVGECYTSDNQEVFNLYVYKDMFHADQTLTVVLSANVRDELIATANGEW